MSNTTRYQYRDREGSLLYEKVRADRPDGAKTIRYRRPAKEHGRWVAGRGDLVAVPYRLPELDTAVAEGNTVFITEGEKCADRLASALVGPTAVTTNGGAGQWPKGWGAEYFVGCQQIFILVDADDPGRKHGEKVAADVRKAVPDVRLVELPGLGEKEDVYDWLDAGHTLDELWLPMEGMDGTEEYLSYRRGKPLEWDEVDRWLNASAAPVAVAAVIPHARELLVVLYVTGQKPDLLAWDLQLEDLHRAVQRWRVGLRAIEAGEAPAPAGFLPELQGVAEWLAKRTEGVSRLYILATAGMHAVPLHAVETGSGPLVAHVPVAYLPSLWLLIRSAGCTRPLPDEPRAFVAGNLTEDLPDAAKEAVLVAQLLDAEPGIGRSVKREDLLAALDTCDVVHIAGHGSFVDISAMSSGLAFYGGGEVTASDIQFLSLSAPLLVLSACNLGRVHTSSDTNAIGFPLACIFSGIGSALLAQWEVDDAVTRKFMSSFYIHLLASGDAGRLDPVAALQSTMLDFIAANEPPVAWAPFAMYLGST